MNKSDVIEKLKKFMQLLLLDDELTDKYAIKLGEDFMSIEFECVEKEDCKLILSLHNIGLRFYNGETVEDVYKVIKNSLLVQSNFELEASYEDIKATLFPQIKGNMDVPEPLVRRTFVAEADLHVYYVRDFGDSMGYVKVSDLEDWGISEEELHEVALKNLENKLVLPVTTQFNGTTANFYTYNSKDGYDATRILTLDIATLKAKFKGKVHAVMPYRDLLIVMDDATTDMVGISQMVKEDYHNKTYAVSPYVFVLNDNDAWEIAR